MSDTSGFDYETVYYPKVPDIEITQHSNSYAYRPCCGFVTSVLVAKKDTKEFIGWMKVDNLPGSPDRAWDYFKENGIDSTDLEVALGPWSL